MADLVPITRSSGASIDLDSALPTSLAQRHAPSAPETETVSHASFGALYQHHYRAIAGAIYRRTGDPDLTEDLTSDVFLAAYRSIDTYRCTHIPVRVWLLRIATNRVNRWARRRTGLRAILGRLARSTPTHAPRPAQADHAEARSALLALPADYQTVLSLHHLEGMSLEVVSLVLACPVSTAKSRLTRARAALRRRLESRPANGDHP